VRPLEGCRIVEMQGIGPAPFGVMMLADMGADVIRIGRLTAQAGGLSSEMTDGMALSPHNRGRRSIAIDLRSPEGVEVAIALLSSADALVEGFRPGVMERLGLGPDQCRAHNERLVYARMTGWGQRGPLADSPGHDINYLAISGALSTMARGGRPPAPPLNLVADYGGGGMMLAFAVACGIVQARQTGSGSVIDVAMIDGVAVMMGSLLARTALGQWRDPPGTNFLDGGCHWYDVFETADGRYMAVGAIETKFYDAYVRALGLDPGDVPQWDRARWPALRELVASIFLGRTRDEWCATFDPVEACVTPVLTMEEAARHPHNRARHLYADVDGITHPAPAPRADGEDDPASSAARFSRAAPVDGAEGITALEVLLA
jgi:alpha-methylacyl-CoA racemase